LQNKNIKSQENFAIEKPDTENNFLHNNQNAKSLTHLKSNSNEIKMEIYEDETYHIFLLIKIDLMQIVIKF